jgi:hypothetical protein
MQCHTFVVILGDAPLNAIILELHSGSRQQTAASRSLNDL